MAVWGLIERSSRLSESTDADVNHRLSGEGGTGSCMEHEFVEQMGPEINEKYMSNLMTYQKRQEKMRANNRDDEEVTQ